jgi:hypothetical protein
MTLTDTETSAMLSTLNKPADITKEYIFYGDVKVVEATAAIVHCGPFKFPLRYAAV